MREPKVLLSEIIQKAFPELLSIDIEIDTEYLENEFALYGGDLASGYFITLNDQNYVDEDATIGLIVHELVHISQDLTGKSRYTTVEKLIYNNHRRYRQLDERNIDFEAILRGFFKETLAMNKQLNFEYGLSVSELETLQKVFKK